MGKLISHVGKQNEVIETSKISGPIYFLSTILKYTPQLNVVRWLIEHLLKFMSGSIEPAFLCKDRVERPCKTLQHHRDISSLVARVLRI